MPEQDKLERLLFAVKSRLKEVERRINAGKGVWPDSDYVRNETWAGDIAEQYCLQNLLSFSGLDETE
jgi:hypothetical protein